MPDTLASESRLGATGSRDRIPIEQASEKTRVVVRWVEAQNSCDAGGMVACATPEIEFHSMGLVGGANEVYVGADGLRHWVGELKRARPGQRLSLAELRDTADRQVVAVGSVEVPGSAGPSEFFGTYEVADGLITHAHHYITDRWTIEASSRYERLVGALGERP
jgi:hypothetical protein